LVNEAKSKKCDVMKMMKMKMKMTKFSLTARLCEPRCKNECREISKAAECVL